ncbi:MAG: hypothetical protein V1765_02070 [bacterium]
MLKHQGQLGFSLLEIVVVASVVMTGFVGILILAERTIQFRSINQKSLIAAQLAQEGLELVRYYRNDNWLRNIGFGQGINYESLGSIEDGIEAIFAIDYFDRTLGTDKRGILRFYATVDGEKIADLNCSGVFECYLQSDYANLYLDTAHDRFYRIHQDIDQALPEAYVDSGFNRLIKTVYYDNNTADNTSDDYLYVVSRVYWQDRGKDYNYVTATYLFDYDWYY